MALCIACGRNREWGFAGIAMGKQEVLNAAAAICPPVLTRDHAVYGGLDGKLHIVPLKGRQGAGVADGVWRADFRAGGGG